MKSESEIVFKDPAITSAVQQLRTVISDITGLTKKLIGMVRENDLDLLTSVFDERRNLLNRAEDIRSRIAASVMNHTNAHEIQQAVLPIILRLYEADAQLISTISTRKDELRHQLSRMQLRQKVALYSR